MTIKTTIDQIADQIRYAIFDGRFRTGGKIKENEIAKWLNVSRTPVREAFRKLEAEGLVEFHPNKSVRIPLITEQDVDEIYEMRTLIEIYCIHKFSRLATAKHFKELQALIIKMEDALARKEVVEYMALGFDFHAYIFKHCQNERMYYCSRHLLNAIRLAQSLLGKNLGYFGQSLKEHKDLFDALKEGSRDYEKILQKHIERSCDRIRNNLSDRN